MFKLMYKQTKKLKLRQNQNLKNEPKKKSTSDQCVIRVRRALLCCSIFC